MKNIPQEIEFLIEKLHDGYINKEEFEILQTWYDGFEDEEIVVDTLDDEISLKKRMKARLDKQVFADSGLPSHSSSRWKYAITAAAAVLLVSTAIYFYQKSPSSAEISTTEQYADGNNLPPTNGAVIILSDKQIINLENRTSFDSKELIKAIASNSNEDNLTLDADESGEFALNQLYVPKGKLFEILLEDGTEVWINADTKLDFPSKFAKNERKVYLEGEAYFDVEKEVDRPFIVRTKQQSIQVLGTEFNVNSYPEREAEMTTLYQGSVEIITNETPNKNVLFPGDEARVKAGMLTIRNVGEANVPGWKQKVFVFENEPLSSILMKVSRWYDVDVSDLSNLPSKRLSGKIRTEADLLETLEIINLASGLKLQVKENKIIKK